MRKILILLLIVFFLSLPKLILAQQCVNGGVTCCEGGWTATGYDSCAYSYPGSCDDSCNPSCPDGSCYWSTETPAPGGGIPTDCRQPHNCPSNSSCVPTGIYSCNTNNINYNSYTDHYVVSLAQYERNCQIGNAQELVSVFSYDQYTWYLREYNCCPAGSVSMYYYSQPANTTHTVSQCDHESTTNCWPGTFVSWVPTYQCGVSPKDEEGNREPLYVGVKTCRPPLAKVNLCYQICSTTAPSNLNFDSVNGRITWTAGTGGTSQNLYVSKTQSDVANNCGSGTNCVVNASLASSATSYTFSPALDAGTVYYAKVRNYLDASCNASSTVYSFLTPIPDVPWWQVKDGDAGFRLV